MKRAVFFATLAGVCALAAFVWHAVQPPEGSGVSHPLPSSTQQQSDASGAVGEGADDSPFALHENDAGPEVDSNGSTSVIKAAPAPVATASGPEPEEGALEPRLVSLDISSLGRTAIADEAFDQWVVELRDNPTLLQRLIDEFRQETNLERRERLSRLLGDVGGADVTLAASELIYSGDPVSRRLGLALLQQVQPGNQQAREIASGLLATETDPTILVDTLTSLAIPGSVDDATRQSLANQVAVLTRHSDVSVRSISLNVLSRWTTDATFTPILLGGLQDEVAVVRETAVYALVGHEDSSQEVIDELMNVASNGEEEQRARRGAILALRGMPISRTLRQQLADIELALDTVRR